MTNAEYHAHHALGSSSIKKLLESPHKFLNGIEVKQTDAMRIGSAVHKLVLEPLDFEEEFTVAPFYDARTKEGKAIKEAFENASAGKTVLKSDDYALAMNCADAINEAIAPFMKDGKAEQSYFSTIDEVDVKCRPDWYNDKLGIIVDLKVVADASPDGFIKSVANFGYYIQNAWYTDIMRSLGHKVNKFVFVAVEKEAPYMVGVYELTPEAIDFGRSEYQRAIDIFKRIDEFRKPIYKDTVTGDVVQMLSLPSYVYYKNNASY